MPARLAFIEETLRATAATVNATGSRRSDYADVKGYLAEADLIAHDTIASALNRAFPGETLLSEEGADGASRGANTLWIADPICGTTNYVGGVPLYTHSLCCMIEGQVRAAGIYHPGLDEMYLAGDGAALLNGQSIRVSNTGKLCEAVVSLNCNQAAPGQDNKLHELLSQLSPPITRRIRVFESANLEMAWVACGRLDAYVNPDDKVWDMAAGSLLVAVAGGSARAWSGRIADLTHCRGVVASNGRVQQELEGCIGKVVLA